MSDKGTIEIILTELSLLLEPLADAAEQPQPEGLLGFVQEIGFDLNLILVDPTPINEMASAISSAFSILRPIIEAGEIDESMIGDIPELIESVSNIIDSFDDFDSLQVKDDFAEIAGDIGRIIFDFLMSEYLASHHPKISSFFLLFGVIREETKGNKKFAKFDYKYLPKLFTDPASIATDLYKWGSNDFDSTLLLKYLKDIFWHLGVDLYMKNADAIAADTADATTENLQQLRLPIFITDLYDDSTEIGFALQEVAADGAKLPGLAIIPFIGGQASFNVDLPDSWELIFKASADASVPYGLVIRPDGVEVSDIGGSAAPPSVEFSVAMMKNSPADRRMILIGNPDGPRLELGAIGLVANFSYSENPDFSVTLPVMDSCLVIDASEGDGFLQNILPADGMQMDFQFSVGWSSKEGFFFEGSGGLEIAIPTHISLGPIDIENIVIGINISDDEIPISLCTSVRTNLGPLVAVVENIGVKAIFSFPPSGGDLGPLDFSLGFKPPNGVGLAIDAGVIKGAGYLFIDTDRGEYAGALELTFSGFLSLKAIGLIATKMPDGSKGFSLLIIITAEFTIQIGLGFVFLGAGGLLGLHRTAKLTPLAEGVRSGATANILFPTNVVENAPQIISDIRIFFPIEENHFLIGPMIKLGWGQPPLITISLGIIIEIRTDAGGSLERIAILGVLKCILPDEKKGLLVLQVNFIGAVDFTKKTGFFFASIFESRVLAFTIEGEMGLLVAWGDDSNFIISVGGFHPRFNPPPLPFPVPKRFAISILNESWGKIRVEGYFAVTTNTVQFGAKIEVKFGFSSFKIDGHLAFDVLFQFNPFYFIVAISGRVSLKVFGAGLFSVSLKLSLEGPTPWRAKGYGKIKILFFSFKARFDKKWGQSKNTTLPPIEVMPIFLKEFSNIQNWQAIAPASSNILVTLRDVSTPVEGAPEKIILHPVGKIKISQRAVPLKSKIDLVGSQKPSDANYFELEDLTDPFGWGTDAKESFPPAQYFDMKSSKKLTEPATRKYASGSYLESATESIKTNTTTVRHVRYELVTIDTAYKRVKKKFQSGIQLLFGVFLKNNAATKSMLAYRQKLESQPFAEKVNVMDGAYSAVYTANNSPYSDESINFETQWEAEDFISEQIANKNIQIDEVHVVPTNEMNIMGKAA